MDKQIKISGTGKDPIEQVRYINEQSVGRGGQASVFLAYDTIRGKYVAIKRMATTCPLSQLQLKKEFRVIQRLIHPNLVRLYELGEDEKGLFFTMEVVQGESLQAYCRPDSDNLSNNPFCTQQRHAQNIPAATADYTLYRLKSTMPQILEALAFLHKSGIVHCDLKPDNILVSENGLVKIVDFGILTEFGFAHREEYIDLSRGISGTPAYMAPEQILGQIPTPSTDLYSLGVILFNLLSGTSLFGASTNIIDCHLYEHPPTLRDVVPTLDLTLADTCDRLLSKDPKLRPSIDELSRLFQISLGSREISVPSWTPPRHEQLFGRSKEKKVLKKHIDTIIEGDFSFRCLSGPTGTGKSALATWTAKKARERGLEIIEGAGRMHERVAFNAVDAAIDQLALIINRKLSSDMMEFLKPFFLIAGTAFPILKMPFAEESRNSSLKPSPQHAVFEALTEIIRAVSLNTNGILFLVDDLQWADTDSLAFLDYLVRNEPDYVSLLATIRDDVEDNPASRWLKTLPSDNCFKVAPLEEGAIREIIENAAFDKDTIKLQSDLIDQLTINCAGQPVLAELSGRFLSTKTLEDSQSGDSSPITLLINSLNSEQRSFLALLIAIDEWTSIELLATLLDKSIGTVEDVVSILEKQCVVRIAGWTGQLPKVDLYHDYIRHAVNSILTENNLMEAHRIIAHHLQYDLSAPREQLVRHLIGCHEFEEAARQAAEAAHEAESKYAYGLAADMYAIALRYADGTKPALLWAQASAFEKSAQYTEAALVYDKLAEIQTGDSLVDALLAEARSLLVSNQIARGRKILEKALELAGEAGLDGNAWSTFLTIVRFLRGPHKIKKSNVSPPVRLNGSDSSQKLAMRQMYISEIIMYFNPIEGLRFLQQAYRRFVELGDVDNIARCEFAFAYMTLLGNPTKGPVPLCQKYQRSARENMKNRSVSTINRIYPDFIRGVSAYRDCQWKQSRLCLRQALKPLEEQGLTGTFEHYFIFAHLITTEVSSQDIVELGSLFKQYHSWSRYIDDFATKLMMCLPESEFLLLKGAFDESIKSAESMRQAFPKNEPTFQTIFVHLATLIPKIYTSDCREALESCIDSYKRTRKFGYFRTMLAGTAAASFAMIEATALRSGDSNASYSRVRNMTRIASRAPAFKAGMALRALAYCEDAYGRENRSVVLLKLAEEEAETFNQPINRAIAMYQRGLRLKGEEGSGLIKNAERIVKEAGGSTALLAEDIGLR